MELNELRIAAQRFFRLQYSQVGFEEIEDFGSYCVEAWLSGKRKTSTPYKYMGIDYMRERTGSRNLVKKTGVNIERVKEDIGSDSKDLNRFIDSDMLRDARLPQLTRCILVLYYEWGFDLIEIGDLLGVNASRVSQMLTAAKGLQKKRMTHESQRHT